MSTLLFYLSLFGVSLFLLSLIPGLKELIKPILQMFTLLLTSLVSIFSSWLILIAKNIIGAHVQLLRHLLRNAEDIDPTYSVRDK